MAEIQNLSTDSMSALPRYGRLPWFAPGDLDERGRALYEAITTGPRSAARTRPFGNPEGRLYGPFNAMLLDPEVGDALQEVGAAIRYRSALAPDIREIAILEVAALLNCEVEWHGHFAIARQLGVATEDLDAIREGVDAPGLSPEARLVRRLVESLITRHDLTDEEFSLAETSLGFVQLADVVFLVGYYFTLATSLAVFRVPLPPN